MLEHKNKRSENAALRHEHSARFWTRARLSGGKLALVIILGGVTAAIAFNAIVLQSQKHPAPLFAAVEAARALPVKSARTDAPAQERASRKIEAEKPVAERPSAEKSPVQRQAAVTPEKPVDDRQAMKALSEKSAEKPSSVKAKPVTAEPAPSRTRQADQLAELIRGGIVPPAAVPDEADPRLLAIQKNLARLGYSTGKPDGIMGPGTRAAIERFEKDRKWTVTGEITARLTRELGTVSAGNRN